MDIKPSNGKLEKDICARPKQRVQMIDLKILKIYTWGIFT